VEEFRRGKSEMIHMIDGPVADLFLQGMFGLGRQGRLDEDSLVKLMEVCGLDGSGFDEGDAKTIADIINQEFTAHESLHHFKKTDRVIIRYLYHRFPRKEITSLLAGYLG